MEIDIAHFKFSWHKRARQCGTAHCLEIAETYGPVHGIIGGLHGTKPEKLKGLDLICATHCTKFKDEIKARYPNSYVEGGVGKVIEV
ncbi:MAG: hypothetical protein ACLFSQ_09310 [Candidatus Zixiibacteriota bacterium]